MITDAERIARLEAALAERDAQIEQWIIAASNAENRLRRVIAMAPAPVLRSACLRPKPLRKPWSSKAGSDQRTASGGGRDCISTLPRGAVLIGGRATPEVCAARRASSAETGLPPKGAGSGAASATGAGGASWLSGAA